MNKFQIICTRYHIRATKVHRLSMQSVEHIIQSTPDVHIIYYIRDPRGIWLSREKRNSPVPIKALCEQMHEDHLLFEELYKKYPDVLMKIKYEDLASYPIRTANAMFSHIGERMPRSVRRYVSSITNSEDNNNKNPHGVEKSNSTATAMAWRKKITSSQAILALQHCSSTIKLLGYDL